MCGVLALFLLMLQLSGEPMGETSGATWAMFVFVAFIDLLYLGSHK